MSAQKVCQLRQSSMCRTVIPCMHAQELAAAARQLERKAPAPPAAAPAPAAEPLERSGAPGVSDATPTAAAAPA